MTTHNVWVVDDDSSIRWVLERTLKAADISVQVFESAESLLEQLEHDKPSVIVSDIRMPGMDGLELLEQIASIDPELPVIIMTAHSDLDSAVSSYELGAFDYLPKPFDVDEALAMIQRAINIVKEKAEKLAVSIPSNDSEIIGEAPAMQEVFRAIGRLSRSNITVLINGESGTGKELVAKALHRHSPRRDAPFIALNMAAIPHDLIESELFGHEKGAFTGAQSLRKGRFEQADGGTLFLDEIGDMPSEAQTRLLRVLADGEFYRVGGVNPIKVDVRIIAATHQDLELLVKENRFREDLFHRLNVIRVHIPRLADRASDIPALANYFLARAAKELDTEVKVLNNAAEAQLQSFEWNGNVRQLENTCRWLTVMAPGREIQPSDLPPELQESTGGSQKTIVQPLSDGVDLDWDQQLASAIQDAIAAGETNLVERFQSTFERTLLDQALDATGGKKAQAAELIGWGRNTLTRKLAELK